MSDIVYFLQDRITGKDAKGAIELLFMPCIIYLSIHTFLKIDSHFQKTSDFYYYRSDVKTIDRYTILRGFEGILIRQNGFRHICICVKCSPVDYASAGNGGGNL